MNVSRQPLDELPADLQDALHRASLYSSPKFASIWQVKSGRPFCWIVREQDRVAAALVGVEFGGGPLARFQAMPDGLPSAVCFFSPTADRKQLSQTLLAAIAGHGYARSYVTDYHNTLPGAAGLDVQSCETAIVTLTPDWNPPDKTLCSEIRKAEREGVAVQPFSVAEHLDDFLDLLRRTETRLGIEARYPDEFYDRLARYADLDPRVAWLIVTADNRPVASHVYLRDGDHALYWISCFDKEFSYLKATQYMLWTQARAFAVGGCTRLNLGQTPPEADTLETFKMKWGGTPYQYRLFTSRSLLGKLR